MSGSDFAQISISLAAKAAPRPAFGVSCLFERLSSSQYAKFVEQSGGGPTVELSPTGWTSTLADLGISAADQAYADARAHFTGSRLPERAFITCLGEPVLEHILDVVVVGQSDAPAYAAPGVYRLDAQGGPYSYTSPGVAQVVTIEIEDVGGGDGEVGKYSIVDGDGNSYSYESGGTNLWTITFAVAEAGVFALTIDGELYSITADVGDSIEDIRDKMFADMGNTVAHPGGHPTWVANLLSTDKITIVGATIGDSIAVAVTTEPTPADMGAVETTPIAPETVGAIATALAAAVTGSAIPPSSWAPVVALGVITITASSPGVDLGIAGTGPTAPSLTQTLVTDHRQTVLVVRNAIKALVDAASHASFTVAAVGNTTIRLTGATAGSVLDVEASTTGAQIEASDFIVAEVQSVLRLVLAQQSRVRIIPQPSTTDAWPGVYKLILFGQTLDHEAVSGDSAEDVRDALLVKLQTFITETTSTALSTDRIDIVDNTAGEAFQIVALSPNSDQAMTVEVIVESYGMANDFARAQQNPNWYCALNGMHDELSIRVLAEAVESAIPRKIHGWQSSDTAIRDTPIAIGTDVGAKLRNLDRLRSWGVWHPSPVSVDTAYEAPFSQWAAVVMTLPPGKVQWHGRILTGFTGNYMTDTQNANLKARRVSFLERFDALERSQMNGGFNSAGRIIDIVRGMDQLEAELNIAMQDLIATNDILPYTQDGLDDVVGELEGVVNRLTEQGSVVLNTLDYPEGLPLITDATPDERIEGVMPWVVFTLVLQAGTTRVRVRGTITQ